MSLHTRFAALAVVFSLAAGFTAVASAHEVKAGSLIITDLWTRATPPQAPTAGGYLTVENTGGEADRLLAATSPVSGRVELHEMAVTDGTMTMRPVGGGIEIPAGETVTLAPGGLHIMFMQLKERFVEGDKVPVTLTFEQAGEVETFLHVQAIGSPAPTGEHEHGGHK